METNILITSDIHESSDSRPSQGRWFQWYISRWSPDRQLAYLHSWDVLTSRSLGRLVIRAKQLGPFSSALFLGDLTSGEGLLTQEAQKQCQGFLAYLDINLFGVDRNIVHGGHDDGYNCQRDLPTVLAGFANAQKFLGPLWQNIQIGKFTIICLCSEVYTAAARFSDPTLQNIAREQTEFLVQELQRADGNVILAIHNPLALKRIEHILKLNSEKIVLTLAGYMHLRAFNIPFYLVPLFRYIHLHVVPSPWGLAMPWGPVGRGGFCTLTLDGDKCTLKYHRL